MCNDKREGRRGVVVFNVDIANSLLSKKFVLERVGYNHHNPNKLVFIFERSLEIERELKESFGITLN